MVDDPKDDTDSTPEPVNPNSFFVYTEFLNILELSQTNTSVKKALENLLIIYYTVKHGKE